MPEKTFESGAEKEKYVRSVFKTIARRYDLLNTVLSFNQDKYWRRFAVEKTGLEEGGKALDVCCGTGLLTLEMAKRVGSGGSVTGVDFCEEMLSVGRANIEKTSYRQVIALMNGNAMALPFADQSFDCVTSAFALRNVPDIGQAVQEMRRVARAGGRVVSLDLAKPGAPVFKQMYYLYFENILPCLGRLGLGLDGPYRWLPESLRQFPHQMELCEVFSRAGLREVCCYELTGGIAAVHVGVK